MSEPMSAVERARRWCLNGAPGWVTTTGPRDEDTPNEELVGTLVDLIESATREAVEARDRKLTSVNSFEKLKEFAERVRADERERWAKWCDGESSRSFRQSERQGPAFAKKAWAARGDSFRKTAAALRANQGPSDE